MVNFILGLKEGYNYPVRKTSDEIVFDYSYWNNVILVDIDYFLNNKEEIDNNIIELKKQKN